MASAQVSRATSLNSSCASHAAHRTLLAPAGYYAYSRVEGLTDCMEKGKGSEEAGEL